MVLYTMSFKNKIDVYFLPSGLEMKVYVFCNVNVPYNIFSRWYLYFTKKRNQIYIDCFPSQDTSLL